MKIFERSTVYGESILLGIRSETWQELAAHILMMAILMLLFIIPTGGTFCRLYSSSENTTKFR